MTVLVIGFWMMAALQQGGGSSEKTAVDPNRAVESPGSQTCAQLLASSKTLLARDRLGEALERLNQVQLQLLDHVDNAARRDLEEQLGVYCSKLGDPSRAVEHFRQCVALQPAGSSLSSGTLFNLGEALRQAGEYVEAKSRLEEAALGFRNSRNREWELQARLSLSDLQFALGHYDLAEQACAEVSDDALEANLPRIQIQSLLRRVRLARAHGDPAALESMHEETLSTARGLADHDLLVRVLIELSPIALSMGSESAASHHEELTSLLKGVDSPDLIAAAEGCLAHYCKVTGHWSDARKHYQIACDQYRLNGQDLGQARMTINLATIQFLIGDSSKACTLCNQGLQLANRLNDRVTRAGALYLSATLQMRAGQLENARATLEEAIQLFAGAADQTMTTKARITLGECLSGLGKREEAMTVYREVEEAARSTRDRYAEARSIARQAELESSSQRHQDARRLAKRAIDTFAEFEATEEILELVDELALAALAEGDVQETRRLTCVAQSLLDRPSLDDLTDRERCYRRSLYACWEEITLDMTFSRLALRSASTDSAESIISDGFSLASNWKGQAVLDGLRRRKSNEPDSAAAESRLEKELIYEANTSSFPGAADRIRDLRDLVDGRASATRVPTSYKRARHRPEPTTVAQIRQTALPQGTALLEYVEGHERLAVYVITRDVLTLLDLGPKHDALAAVKAFTGSIIDNKPLESIIPLGNTVFLRLMDQPLGAITAPVNRLIIVPTASLCALPFAALPPPTEQGGDGAVPHYLGETYDISYVPSSGVLIELAQRPAHYRFDRAKALILGDPDVGLVRESVSDAPAACFCGLHPLQRGALGRLRYARREAIEVAQTIIDRRRDIPTGDREGWRDQLRASSNLTTMNTTLFDLYLGHEASAERLSTDPMRYSLIHIAAHGLVDSHSLSKTGLLLAPRSATDTGFLSIEDLLDWRLDDAMVVLSACDTARGPAVRGEGVESMAWAFLSAGARGVVATLWKVDDELTWLVMEEFYAELINGGLEAAQALASAQRHVLSMREMQRSGQPLESDTKSIRDPSHPYYWAPFVYIGG